MSVIGMFFDDVRLTYQKSLTLSFPAAKILNFHGFPIVKNTNRRFYNVIFTFLHTIVFLLWKLSLILHIISFSRNVHNMIADLYHDMILAGWLTALVLGLCLLFCRVPDRPVYRLYLRSRRILGSAYLIFAVGIAQFTLFNLRETAPGIAVALPLSYYYLEGILFGMSFSSLLDRAYISRRQLLRDFGGYAVFLIIAWGGALFAGGGTRLALLIAASAWFFVMAGGIAIRFLRIYSRSVNRINDYYSDNVEAFMKWLHKSTYGIIFFGLCGSVLSFSPPCGNTIFMLCGIVMFVYIFISFQNYILNFEYVEMAVTEIAGQERCGPASNNNDAALRLSVAKWVEDGGYRQPGVTLDQLAALVGSNRSYVSSFINTGFRCNFREWVNSLRMDYAKKMLAESSDMTIEKIATDAGFSSSAYFCRLFSKREGLTPSKWRETKSNIE